MAHFVSIFPVQRELLEQLLKVLGDPKQFSCHFNSVLPQVLLFIWLIIKGKKKFSNDF